MSDRPNDRNPEGTERRSGWRTPDKTSGREPQQQAEAPAQQSAWRVPSLPRDLSVEPEKSGAWHLPKPQDTTYSPEDEVVIPAEAPPTTGAVEVPIEELNVIPFDGDGDGKPDAAPATSTPAAEASATPAPAEQDRVAAALEMMDEEDEDDSFSMSELIALASLADAASSASSSAPVSEETQLDAGTGEVMATEGYDPSDPVAYARRQLDLLQQRASQAEANLEAIEESGTSAQPAIEPAPTSVDPSTDPAEYARQQLARLQQQSGAAPAEASQAVPAAAPVATALTADERVLAQKFHDAESKVRDLRAMFQRGEIDRTQFEQGLRQSMVLDDNRLYWMLGTESDRWYKHENGQWIPATPAVLEKETGGASSSPAPTYTAAPTFDADVTAPTATITDDQWIPAQVPVSDPEATMPGTGGIFLNTDQGTVPSRAVDLGATVPGRAFTDMTLPNQPVNQYESIAAPANFAAATPPYAVETPLYEEAVERQRQNTARTVAIVAALVAGLVFVVGTIGVIAAVAYYNNLADPYRQQILALASYQPQFQTVRILAADNSVIAELTSPQGGARTRISLSDMSPEIIHAIVSVENDRFFQDPGFDVVAIGRAFLQNVTAGEIESGASTITQQIAKNLVLQDTTVSAQRKLQEIVVAAEIARQYDKNFILELYLNEIYFGNQSYGVEAAAEFYFNHSAADLNLAESALLAGLIQAPALYDPVINRDTSFDRMNVILNQQARVGCLQFQHAPYNTSPFCVTSAQVNSPQIVLEKARVETAPYLPRQTRVNYPHFVNYIQQQIEANFGTSEMFRRGFEIRTTLIPRVQQVAQSALQQQVQALAGNGINTGAVMVTDPRDGAIRAMIGSPNFNDDTVAGQVNNAFTWQQPGSAIKPVEYVAALEGVDVNGTRQYFTPATILWDVPVSYDNPAYTPTNYDRTFHGPTALRYALANSYNIPAIKTYAFIGNERFVDTATRMGLRFLPEATFGLPSAVGANEVRLYDMMQMYGTIANNGVRVPLYAITAIETADGETVAFSPDRQTPQAIQPQIAFLMQSILSDNDARAAAFGVNSPLNISGYGSQVAAKTGTSNDSRDLWTMGFSHNAVVGVWIGRHDNGATVNTSGLAAAPIWSAVMTSALQGTQPGAFTAPQGIVQQQVCAETGTVYDPNNPTPGCRSVRPEYFIANSPPASSSQSFVATLAIDTWSGLRANQFCPEFIETRTFANIGDSSAVAWLNTPAGQAYAQSVGLPANIQPAPAGQCDQNTVKPNIQFSNLADGQQVSGLVQVQGIVTGPNFSTFRLELAPETAPTSFIAIAGPFGAQQPGGTLATWDSTTVANGAYRLRLSVQSTNGGFAQRIVSIGVNNQPTPTPTIPMPTLIIPTIATLDPFATPIPFGTAIPFSAQGVGIATFTPSGFVPMGGLSDLAPTPTIDFN